MSNLPPGTTPQDIDDNFGEPDMVRVLGHVIVPVETKVQRDTPDKEIKQQIMAEYEGGVGSAEEVELIDMW